MNRPLTRFAPKALLPQKVIHNFTTTHTNVFFIIQSLTDINRFEGEIIFIFVTLRSMISSGKSNSPTIHRGIAPPHGLQLSILRSTRKVSQPPLAKVSAAHAPAGPPPMTATRSLRPSRAFPSSYSSQILDLIFCETVFFFGETFVPERVWSYNKDKYIMVSVYLPRIQKEI